MPGIEVSQNCEKCQGIDVLHKKQGMEMNQNKLKIVLEHKRLENGELKRDTSGIQLPRCLKLIPTLTACVLRSLVRDLLWARSFPSYICQISHLRSLNEVFAVAYKFHSLTVQL